MGSCFMIHHFFICRPVLSHSSPYTDSYSGKTNPSCGTRTITIFILCTYMQKHKLLVIRSKLLSHPPPFAIRKEMEIDEIFFSLVYRAKKNKTEKKKSTLVDTTA